MTVNPISNGGWKPATVLSPFTNGNVTYFNLRKIADWIFRSTPTTHLTQRKLMCANRRTQVFCFLVQNQMLQFSYKHKHSLCWPKLMFQSCTKHQHIYATFPFQCKRNEHPLWKIKKIERELWKEMWFSFYPELCCPNGQKHSVFPTNRQSSKKHHQYQSVTQLKFNQHMQSSHGAAATKL